MDDFSMIYRIHEGEYQLVDTKLSNEFKILYESHFLNEIFDLDVKWKRASKVTKN